VIIASLLGGWITGLFAFLAPQNRRGWTSMLRQLTDSGVLPAQRSPYGRVLRAADVEALAAQRAAMKQRRDTGTT
jgi:hypothetical protein